LFRDTQNNDDFDEKLCENKKWPDALTTISGLTDRPTAVNQALGTRERASMRKATGFLPALALGVAGAISAVTPSLATPINYIETATGASGFLGPTAFTSATVTLTMNNNTTNVTENTSQTKPIFDNVGTLTLSISSISGVATFNMDTFEASANQNTTGGNPAAGFGDVTANRAILFTENATQFGSYDLKSAIGPVTGTAFYFSASQQFPTNEGAFVLTSFTSSASATFTATVPAPVIGHGLPGFLAIIGVLVGARLFERGKRRRLLGTAIRHSPA
jgi:hypothetical protein